MNLTVPMLCTLLNQLESARWLNISILVHVNVVGNLSILKFGILFHVNQSILLWHGNVMLLLIEVLKILQVTFFCLWCIRVCVPLEPSFLCLNIRDPNF